MHKYKRMKVFGTSIFLLKLTGKMQEIIQIAETNERHIKKELANQLLSADGNPLLGNRKGPKAF